MGVGRRGHTIKVAEGRQGSRGCGDGVGRTKKMAGTAGKRGWEASCASNAKRH